MPVNDDHATILVVDDEREIADLVALYLENEGHEVIVRYDARTALQVVDDPSIRLDMAILDVMLPDVNGFQVCRAIRTAHRFPVIMLTARDREVDTIAGLNFGADDYVTKPFMPLELVARVNAQLRRYRRYDGGREPIAPPPDDGVVEINGLSVNTRTHECRVDGAPVHLTPSEFTILATLCRRRGEVVSAEELFHAIWGDEAYLKTSNTISVHIRHLRDKIGDSVERPRYIHTVWGVGYRIDDNG